MTLLILCILSFISDTPRLCYFLYLCFSQCPIFWHTLYKSCCIAMLPCGCHSFLPSMILHQQQGSQQQMYADRMELLVVSRWSVQVIFIYLFHCLLSVSVSVGILHYIYFLGSNFFLWRQLSGFFVDRYYRPLIVWTLARTHKTNLGIIDF